MNATELEFEKPFIELERHLAQLKSFAQTHPDLDLTEGIDALKQNADTLTKQTFQKLSRWDKSTVSAACATATSLLLYQHAP